MVNATDSQYFLKYNKFLSLKLSQTDKSTSYACMHAILNNDMNELTLAFRLFPLFFWERRTFVDIQVS